MNVDFFSKATDMSVELSDLEIMLAGKKVTVGGEIVDDPDKEEVLNAKGRAIVLTILSSALNKNTFMSDLRPERVAKMVFETSEDVQIALFLKREEYGLKSMELYGYIITIIENFLETAFARPIEGRERGIYNSMSQEMTHRVIEGKEGDVGSALSGLLGKQKSRF